MGFDNECILNIQSLAGEYFCPVCRLLVYPNEALQSQCTHLYCKPCLAYVVSTTRACPYDGYLVTEADSKPLIESNKALAETIGKIAVHCLYHRSGCQWQGPLSECISHCSGCAFGNSPVVCNRCGVQIVHRQVQEHAQNCPGVQSQTQQAEGVQDAAAQGAAAAADQSQTAAQAGALASQTQPAQITPASAPVQDLNQQVNSTAQAAAPTPEQWYQQQQQQYQQYYQQYPGYDPYQQHYQQYYPYQQQAVQYQHPHPAQLSGQPQPQPQPQPQAQLQPLVQPQPQTQPQLQPQPQTQPQLQPQPQQQPQMQPQQQPQPQLQSQPPAQAQLQPQPQPLLQAQTQAQTQTQPQPHSLVQAPVAVQHQNQVANQQAQNHPVAQQHSQIQSQTHPPHHGHQHPQTLQYPQAQSHPQPHSVQPRPQQHLQLPQYQQPHPPMPHPQSQIQRQPNSQLLPQHHHLPQPQTQPLSQTQQPTLQPHPQPHPHPHALPQHHPSQPNQTPNPNPQSQTQPPSAHAVTGHHSFPQPRPQQQMPLGGMQQQPMHMHPQAQFPQQSPQMRPSQAHAQSQQQSALLPLPGQAQNVLPPQQLPVHPHQQAGHPVHQRAAMQPIQQSLPHQFVQQPPLGTSQNQLHQQGSFMQPPTPTMQSQLRPQAPPQSWQQHSHAYPQPQQKVAMLHGMQPHQPQNVGRPVMPNQGVQPQPFPQSQAGLSGAVQLRLMHLGPNQPSANQTLGQHLEQSAHPQPGLNVKQTTFEKPGDDLSKKGVGGQEGESFSEKTAREDANGVAATSGIESNTVEIKSETDMKSMDEKQKTTGEDEDTISRINNSAKEIPESMRALGSDPVQQASEDGEPVIKQMVKEEVIKSTVERSPGGKSIGIVVEDQKDELSVPPKQVEQVEHSLLQDKEIQNGLLMKNPTIQQVEILDEMGGKLQKDSGDASGVMQLFTATNRGTEAVPPAPIPDSSAQNATPRGSVSVSERKMLNQPGNQERNLLQAPTMPQGPSNDEYRGFPPPSQVQGRGFVPLPHPVPILDGGRHQPPPMQYGPTVQQRPAAPSSGQAMPPPGLVHNAPVPGQPSTQLQPQALGLLPHPAQQSRGSFHHEIPPGGILGPGSAASFGRGLSHFAPPQRSFEPPSVVSQGHYNQGHGLPSHAGPSRISQGELIGRPPLGPLPAGSFDSHGGMMVRAPPHGPEGQQRPVNPVESEIFSNPRPNYFDGRQSDSHIPGSSERGPFGQPSGIQSNMMRMNGGLGIESSLPVGLQDERFKSLPEPGRRSSDHGKFAEDLKQFSRSSHLDSDLVPKFGNYFSSSRPLDRGSQGFVMDAAQGLLDKAPLGFNYDSGFKSSAGTGTSRFFPPPHPGGDGERSRAVGFHEDNVGRSDMARTHPNFLGSVPEYGRHHMDGLNPRSPTREFSGIPHRGFGGLSGVPGRQSDLDDIDGRESRRFGEGSKTFNLPSDESRFPVLPSHLRRGELEGPGELVMADPIASRSAPHHLRGGDLIGQDILPSHLQRGEHFGSRNIPGQLRFGEPVFDAFLGHPRMGELSGPGNFPSRLSAGESFGGSNKSGHPRIGEPGFRSTYSLHGYPNDHGFRPGDMESFDNSRKRKPLSMAWCRICNIDCETVDGLELHSQTREHQQMAMDIVLSIKQQNAKKQKLTSKDHSTPEDSSKSKKGVLRGAGISIKP